MTTSLRVSICFALFGITSSAAAQTPPAPAQGGAAPTVIVVTQPPGQPIAPPGYQVVAVQPVAPVAPLAPSQMVPPTPPGPQREGFTLDLSLGIGYLHVSFKDDSYSRGGLYGLNLGLGAFLSPDIALTFRFTGVSVFEEGARLTVASGLGSVQVFVGERVTLGGGVGFIVATITESYLEVRSDPGFALNGRAGLTLTEWESGALRVLAELNLGRIEDATLVNTGLGLEYQMY